MNQCPTGKWATEKGRTHEPSGLNAKKAAYMAVQGEAIADATTTSPCVLRPSAPGRPAPSPAPVPQSALTRTGTRLRTLDLTGSSTMNSAQENRDCCP